MGAATTKLSAFENAEQEAVDQINFAPKPLRGALTIRPFFPLVNCQIVRFLCRHASSHAVFVCFRWHSITSRPSTCSSLRQKSATSGSKTLCNGCVIRRQTSSTTRVLLAMKREIFLQCETLSLSQDVTRVMVSINNVASIRVILCALNKDL